MPTVGKGKGAKHFGYDKKGMAAAKQEAKKTGKPLEMAPPPLPPKRGGFRGKTKK